MATIKNKHVKAVIQLRRATEQEWIYLNPVLRLGEPCFSTDVYKEMEYTIGKIRLTWDQTQKQ